MEDTIEVLLVEDNHADVFSFKQLLKNPPFYLPKVSIGVSHSIKEAEDMLIRTPYDVILLDLNLPDSFELTGLKSLVDKFPEVAIVVYSGIYTPKLVTEAISMGAQDYLVKGAMNTDEMIRILVHAKLRHIATRRLYNLIKTQ